MIEQYQDGTFGEVKSLPDKFKELLDMIHERQAKITAIHCGTREEIEVKRKTILDEIAKLKGF